MLSHKYSLLTIILFLCIFHFNNAQQLSVDEELSFSTTAGKESGLRELVIANTGDDPLIIQRLALRGKHTSKFNLRTPITFPAHINPDKQLILSFSFEPEEIKGLAVVDANLTIQSNDSRQGEKLVKLYGLVAKGLEGENEPPLSMILQTLGYRLDIGSNQLELDTTDIPLEAEVKVSLFKKADASQPVMLIPVARYSPKAAVPFGYYYRNTRDQLRYKKAGTLSDAYQEHQTIYPRLISGQTSFDPRDSAFGVFISTSSHVVYSETGLNTGLEHAVRIFPLTDRAGNKIPNNYLLCFEETSIRDYQDFIFVLKNVQIVR